MDLKGRQILLLGCGYTGYGSAKTEAFSNDEGKGGLTSLHCMAFFALTDHVYCRSNVSIPLESASNSVPRFHVRRSTRDKA